MNPTAPAILLESVLGAGSPAVCQNSTAKLETGEIVKVINIVDPGIKAGTLVNLMRCKKGNTEEWGDWVIVAADIESKP